MSRDKFRDGTVLDVYMQTSVAHVVYLPPRAPIKMGRGCEVDIFEELSADVSANVDIFPKQDICFRSANYNNTTTL